MFRKALPSIQLGSSYGAVNLLGFFDHPFVEAQYLEMKNQVDFHAVGIHQRWAHILNFKSIPKVIRKHILTLHEIPKAVSIFA